MHSLNCLDRRDRIGVTVKDDDEEEESEDGFDPLLYVWLFLVFEGIPIGTSDKETNWTGRVGDHFRQTSEPVDRDLIQE